MSFKRRVAPQLCLHPKVPYQPHDHAGKWQQRNTAHQGRVHYKATTRLTTAYTLYVLMCLREAGGRGDLFRSNVDAAPPADVRGVRRVARRGQAVLRRSPTPLLDFGKRVTVKTASCSVLQRGALMRGDQLSQAIVTFFALCGAYSATVWCAASRAVPSRAGVVTGAGTAGGPASLTVLPLLP